MPRKCYAKVIKFGYMSNGESGFFWYADLFTGYFSTFALQKKDDGTTNPKGFMQITVSEQDIVRAAGEGMDAFLALFHDRIMEAIGGQLNADTMPLLNGSQITVLAYVTLRSEVMDGGFVQLIHNGYGPFIFLNPFAKAMRLWGAHDFSNLVYKGRKLYEKYADELTAECTDEEFMALFEQYPEFDDLDDAFVEMEEEVTDTICHYIDEHIDDFVQVSKE